MQKRRASTLIELLVVIFIIGLLASILLPSLRRSVRLASNTLCMHNLKQVGNLLDMYRFDYDGWLPISHAPRQNAIASGQSQVWFQKLYPTYLTDPVVLTCPEDPYRHRMLQARDRLDSPQVSDYASYGINSFILTAGEGALANVERYSPSRPLDTILVADLGPDYASGSTNNTLSSGPARNESLLSVDDGFDILLGNSEPWLTVRHRRGINVLTLAGGIRNVTTDEVLNQSIENFYPNCHSGGCTLCREELRLYHYSFAKDRLFWWTGRLPNF